MSLLFYALLLYSAAVIIFFSIAVHFAHYQLVQHFEH